MISVPQLFSPEEFLPSAEEMAPQLLGHFLLRRMGEEWVGGPIVETEAYLVGDPACHAYKKETQRNRVMWGEPGGAYVYLIYGFYNCVNVVCQPKGVAEAVLIRAIEPTIGIEAMQSLRDVPKPISLTNGPSKLCLAMNITRELDGYNLCDPNSPIILARNPDLETYLSNNSPRVKTTRIGITQAADWPLRWYLGGSKFVSKR